jgi:two-component system response regulator (stage 0 sporulation protein F)
MDDKITLLYVDDEQINLTLFKINFGKKYNVLSANSGQEALEILKSNRAITVVISDMKMPGMNGIEFIKQAKKEYPNIIYFILTGYGFTDEISDAIESRLVNKYFSKPFDMNDLAASIDESGISKLINM